MGEEAVKPAGPQAVTKRGRGRPRKYLSQEDKREARRAQILKSVRAWRQRQVQNRSSPPESASETSLITPGVTPRLTPAEELLFDTSAWINGTPYDSASIYDCSEEELYSNAVVLFQAQEEASAPSIPLEIQSSNKSIFMDSLFTDFLSCIQGEEVWWPHLQTAKLPGLAGQLVDKSHVAAWASSVGMTRKDPAMLRLAESANLETITLLRKYTNDQYIQRLAIPLVIMAYDLINYEFKEFMRGDATVPTTMTWAMHGVAANTIVQAAGPAMFSSGLGAKILLGLLPQSIMTFCGLRVRMIFDADNWLAMLEQMNFPAFKDSVWPLAVHIPTLMQELDMILANGPASTEAAFSDALQDLYRRVLLLSAHFDKWIAMFPRDSQDSPELFNSSTLQTASVEPFQPRIEFPTMTAGHSVMLYWTFKLLIAILAEDIYQNLRSADVTKWPDPVHDLPIRYACLICRAIPYWMQIKSFSSSTAYMSISWPLRVAWNWFSAQENMKEHVAWCANISSTLRTLPIAKIGEYVIDFVYSSVKSSIGRGGSQIRPQA